MTDHTTYRTETPRCACGEVLYGDRTHVCRPADRFTVTHEWRGGMGFFAAADSSAKSGLFEQQDNGAVVLR